MYNVNLNYISPATLSPHDQLVHRQALDSYSWDELYDIADTAQSAELRDAIRDKARIRRYTDEYAAFGDV